MPLDILSSLPRDLIRTNRAPNETELASARAMLTYFEDEISEISAQIEQAEVRLHKLSSARRTLQRKEARLKCVICLIFNYWAEVRLRKLNSARRTLQRKEARLKCVVAPIRRVPQDVICLIFNYCLHECCVLEDDPERFCPSDIIDRHGSNDLYPSLYARRLPLRLTHVSSGFRTIVLAMPTLWKMVEFRIQSPSLQTWAHHRDSDHYKHVCISQRNRISGMKEWLRRSGSLPLYLEVYISNPPYNTYEELQEFYNGMIDIVMSCHTRWRDIRFSFDQDPPAQMITGLLALTSEDLPSLRTLRFHSYGFDRKYLRFMPMFACPSLKTLTGVWLDDLHIHKNLLRSSCSNLTLLDARIGPRSLIIGTTLQQCTSLIELRLLITEDDDVVGVPEPVIELPCLQELYVIDDLPVPEGEQYSMKTIKCISAPNLNKFYYKKQWSKITMLPDIFKGSHNLTTLGLAVDISCDLFIEILRYCPQITCLDGLPNLTHSSLDRAVAYDGFLIRLVDADDTGDIICPKLERMNGGHDLIPIVNFSTLYAIVTRKGTESSANMAPWRMLRANIICMHKDETTVRQLLRKCNRNTFVLIFYGFYDDL